ncbi:MAG: spore coat protein CotJB [Firmicutes bacterium]|uniref:CotJB protein n=1 Tax=Melghirimyces thermohalophilus TaxID=1236220 RepID=A0A1G6QEF3_9BACL|nr:spore coat protein CotJB [Melghirimyces thermohalophilus]MDA8351882.1 spore coat protein CotJB [Bacillota bacterium]SDC90759.1 CotJB protein [Melghirimyces thermohalophilus]
MNPNDYRLLGELQTVDFLLSELQFHLNSHPEDSRAQAQQEEVHQLRRNLKREYDKCIHLLHSAQEQLSMKIDPKDIL